jgi:triphosphoribosyl-dephospho-CoA synthase
VLIRQQFVSPNSRDQVERVGTMAGECLKLEVGTYPKPGLVSHVDSGAHSDMDAGLLGRSADTLVPFFADLAAAGAAGATMSRLRVIGLEAEQAMMAATAGINTHRGAIFGLGLLAAAAGLRLGYGIADSLGQIVANRWGADIASGPMPLHSHGALAARRYAAGGARMQGALGFPAIYDIGLPAFREARRLAPDDSEAARVQTCMALIAAVDDTNLLYRGGIDGLAFASASAAAFLENGGIAVPGWRAAAADIHAAFVARNLSPGGCADLLAMTLFVDALE